MKKSRIIIPALAMIAFSMAASITGAVAWFTAQRTVSFNAGSYAVVSTTSNLECEITGGVGTSVSNGIVVVGGKLTDGSFDHVNKKIYTPNESGTGIAAGNKGEIALNDNNLATLLERGSTKDGSSTVSVYTAVTFHLKFTITFGAATNDVALLLDCYNNSTQGSEHSGSKFTVDGTPVTATGFRMAFVAEESAGSSKVFADLQTASNCKYVDGTVTSDWKADNSYGGHGAYNGDLIDSAYNTAIPSEPQSSYSSRVDFLGTFANASQDTTTHKVSLNYTVVCWFEGTDPNVINHTNLADFQEVAANLCFEAKDVAA